MNRSYGKQCNNRSWIFVKGVNVRCVQVTRECKGKAKANAKVKAKAKAKARDSRRGNYTREKDAIYIYLCSFNGKDMEDNRNEATAN